MKKLKRSVALSVSLIMALSLMPQMAMAAQTPEYTTAYEGYFKGWSRWDAATADGNMTFSCVTDEIAHSGNNSIVLRHTDDSQKMKNICLAQSDLTLEAGTYTISFWAVGTRNDIDMQGITLADPWRKYSMQDLQAVETDGIWSRYEIEVTMEGTETAITFVTDGDTEGWYIDDISLVKKDTTNNRIKNGSFDYDGGSEYTSDHEKYFINWTRWGDAPQLNGNVRFSCVTDKLSHSGNNSVVLKNVDTSGSVKIIYDINLPTGIYTASFWCAGAVTANDSQCVTLNGDNLWVKYSMDGRAPAETDGIWSRYEFDIEVPEGKTGSSIAFFSDRNTEGWYLDDISLIKQGTTENLIKNGSFEEKAAEYTSAYEDYFTGWDNWSGAQADNNLKFMCVTADKAHSGNHSILIRHVGAQGNNQNICLAQSGLTLEAGTYTISFWAVGTKTDSDIQGVTLADPWRKYSMKNRQAVETDGIWSRYEIEVTMEGTETAVTFVTDGDTEGWYIDDISLVKQGTTNNRIKNGGFEFTNNAVYTDKYEKYFAGWGRWDAITPDKVQTFSCVTDAIAHDGNNSVVIRHTDSANAWKAIVVVQEGLSLTGTYTFSFWAAGDYAANTNCITVNGEAWEDYYLNDFTVSQSEGLWKKYTIDITIPEGKTNNAITLASNGSTNGWYIDDISLIKQGTTENLVKNGSFESDGIPKYTDAHEAYFSGWTTAHAEPEPDKTLRFSCVTDEVAHSGSHSVLLRHADSSNTMHKIAIRQDGGMLDGTYTLSFWSIGTRTDTDMQAVTFDGYGGWQITKIKNFSLVDTDGIWTKYSMDIPVNSGNYSFTMLTDGDTTGWYIDDISLTKQGETKNLIQNGDFEFNGVIEYENTESPVSSYAIKSGGKAVDSLYNLTDFDIEVEFKNEIYQGSAVVLAGVYDGIKLISSTATEGNIGEDNSILSLKISLDKPYIDGYSLKLFVWDGLDTIKPVIPAIDPAQRVNLLSVPDGVELHNDLMLEYLNDSYENVHEYASGGIAKEMPKPVTFEWVADKAYSSSGYTLEISENADMSESVKFFADTNVYRVYNLKVGTRYYWRVSAADENNTVISEISSFTTTDKSPRYIYAEGLSNARDVGGWSTLDGGRVKQGLVYRSYCLDYQDEQYLTPAGIDTLVNGLGIKTEIDLRNEVSKTSSILGNNVNYYRYGMDYSGSGFLSDNKDAIKNVFEALADSSNYPVIWHCQVGADRTGAVTYLLNALLGVAKEDLLRDYLLTNFAEVDHHPRHLSGMMSAYAADLDEYPNGNTLSEKVYNYLNEEIGVSKADLDFIKNYMVEYK